MKLLEKTVDSQIRIEISQEELAIIANSMNEVCNGIDIDEFDTRIGASIESVKQLLREVGSI
jgi:hypothetical protein